MTIEQNHGRVSNSDTRHGQSRATIYLGTVSAVIISVAGLLAAWKINMDCFVQRTLTDDVVSDPAVAEASCGLRPQASQPDRNPARAVPGILVEAGGAPVDKRPSVTDGAGSLRFDARAVVRGGGQCFVPVLVHAGGEEVTSAWFELDWTESSARIEAATMGGEPEKRTLPQPHGSGFLGPWPQSAGLFTYNAVYRGVCIEPLPRSTGGTIGSDWVRIGTLVVIPKSGEVEDTIGLALSDNPQFAPGLLVDGSKVVPLTGCRVEVSLKSPKRE